MTRTAGRQAELAFCTAAMAQPAERAMVRNYIKQSVKQWVQLYGFDGFRFDLMGILDRQTMMEIQEELAAIYPNIYLYGEGWRMDTGLDRTPGPINTMSSQLRPYGFFSDNFVIPLNEASSTKDV